MVPAAQGSQHHADPQSGGSKGHMRRDAAAEFSGGVRSCPLGRELSPYCIVLTLTQLKKRQA